MVVVTLTVSGLGDDPGGLELPGEFKPFVGLD